MDRKDKKGRAKLSLDKANKQTEKGHKARARAIKHSPVLDTKNKKQAEEMRKVKKAEGRALRLRRAATNLFTK